MLLSVAVLRPLWIPAILTVGIASQTSPDVAREPAPGGIRLLPGYTHRSRQGIDTLLGDIVKQGGPTISYEIGSFGTDPTAVIGGVRWIKDETIQGKPVRVVMANNRWLLVGHPLCKFVGRNVTTDEDVLDVVLTALTFDVDTFFKELTGKNLPDQSPGLQQPSNDSLPSGIRLQPGYTHVRRQAMEAKAGDVVKKGGPKISYLIGAFVPSVEREEGLMKWRKRQQIGAMTFHIVMKEDGTLVAGDGAAARFEVHGIKTHEDLIEVLLTVLTFDRNTLLKQVADEWRKAKGLI